jgi:predicted dehydrogenase
MKLRVGLIGLGEAWEDQHRPALRALADRFEVRAVCDQIGHRAHWAAAEFGASAVDGFRSLAAREDIDAVLMLSPQWYGSLPILAACDFGKAVYLGHGLPMEPELAATIRQRVEKAGIAFMAEFPRRQSPATLRLKELIATRLGPPRLLFCHHRLPMPQRNHASRRCRLQATMRQELTELVDWCRYVVGKEPSWVTGISHGGAGGSE